METIEDGMTFVMRAGTAMHDVGIDSNRRQVLEVNQLWGDTLLDARHFSQIDPQPVTIGSSLESRWSVLGVDLGRAPSLLHRAPGVQPAGSSFFVDDDALPDGFSHVLFHFLGDRYVARIPQGWDGFIDRGERRFDLDEAVLQGLARACDGLIEVPMVPGIRLAVEVAGVTWFAHLVAAGSRLATRGEPLDLPFVGIGSMLVGLGCLFALAMGYLPSPPEYTVNTVPNRFRVVELQAPPEEPEPALVEASSGEESAPREEGEAGKREAVEKIASGGAAQQKRQRDLEVVSQAGLIGFMNDHGGAAGDFGAGLDGDLVASAGGLIGTKGNQFGRNGLGNRGNGFGPPGDGEGMGQIGTHGIGPGANGYAHTGRKTTGVIRPMSNVIVIGGLDRSLIDAEVKRHTRAIRYCYQRQLTQHPALSGKVSVKFTIAKDGSVSRAGLKSSSLGNAVVESCVVSRFQRMRFPAPSGGGIVIVSYPFFFAPG